jgi:MraZ protein
MDYWIKLRKVMDKKLNMFNSQHREFYRRFTSGATELVLDAADRLNIPKHLMEYATIKSDCYLTPGQNTIEMWSVATYEARLKNFDSNAYQDIANEVMGSINLWDDDTTTF